LTLGLDAYAMSGSSLCVTVVESGTSHILLEFDCTDFSLGVMPMPDESGAKPLTWFRGYKYFGGFEYSRTSGAENGNNLTVVNYVNIDDYVKGVLPYEMSSGWPLEALKAQALCARNYVACNLNKHKTYNFDVCATTDCQVYNGDNAAQADTNLAVDQTSGQYITYNGEIAEVFYSSSDGGATEDSENVFNDAFPWLRGIVDEYEQFVQTGYESWTQEYTASEITALLQKKGYSCTNIVSITPIYTPLENMFSVKFTDSNGRNFTFEREQARTIWTVDSKKKAFSPRYTLTAKGSQTEYAEGQLYVLGQSEPFTDTDVYAIGGNGEIAKIEDKNVTIISASGTSQYILGEHGQKLVSGVTQYGDVYVLRGSGNGHNVGLSQWGARAMAEQGKTYEEIVKYYFTGVEILK